LDTNLRLQLSPEEEDVLFQKYDLKHDGTICYREFCDVINRSKSFMLLIQCYSYLSEYPETTITPHPESFTNTAPPYLNSWRSTRHVGTQDESERLQNVLQRIATFSKQRGVDILTTMEQYDKHKMGEITDSQFYRAFFGPKLTEAEMTLLRDKYSDPGKPGLINYLNFVQDLTAYSHANETTVPATNNNNFEQIPFVGVEEKVNFVLFISVNNFLLFIA
jgi:Ca2+-binding EF-hand superfamily protein